MKRFLHIIFALILVTIISCKKEKASPPLETDSTPSSVTINKANAIALINNLSTAVETYTIDASNFDTYYCANGTIIDIYPDAFLTQAGIVATGIVTIEVKDILSKRDMILNNAIPVSNGQLLVSGGEVYFNATQGGQKLKINPASQVNIKIPAGTSPSYHMQEFYSQGSVNLSNNNLNWQTTATDTIAVNMVMGHFHYEFNLDEISWVNADYYYSLPGNKTSCTVNLSGGFNNTNSLVFISMNGTNALTMLSSSNSILAQGFESNPNSLPEGKDYTVVAISFDGTNYYYESQSITMISNMVINFPSLTQVSKNQIPSQLNLLQ